MKTRSEEKALEIRELCLEVAHGTHNVHIGGSLSEADLLAVLYTDVLNVDPADPKKKDRDRFILSKGHSCSGYYATLAVTGFISREEMLTQYQDDSRISGHISHHVEGVEISTGSLGHGLPIATGMALHAKLKGDLHRVFVLCGDGEMEEGSMYEAVNFAGSQVLDRLVCIVDSNQLQAGSLRTELLSDSMIRNLFADAGWDVEEIDGHDHEAIRQALTKTEQKKPLCIIAHTVKGKGVSFMENNPGYHSNKLNDDLYLKAKAELEEAA